jgi:hypothetical protein
MGIVHDSILPSPGAPKGTSIALAILAIVYLFYQGRFIMNLIEGSQTIPTFVDLKNALVFGSRLTFRMVRLTFKML